MLENIFEYSLLSFLLSIVLILLVLVKTNIKMWQLWLLAVGLTYPGAVIANHFGAQFLLLILFAVGALLVPVIRQLFFTKPLYNACLLYTSPSPRDGLLSRMPSSRFFEYTNAKPKASP